MRYKPLYLLQIVLIGILFAFSHTSIKVSNAETSIDAEALIIDDWLLDSMTEGSYDDFVLLWNDLGVLPSDYLISEISPSDVKLLIYQHVNSDATVYVEIHLYDSMEDAELEYNSQKARSRPPIFERFLYGERIFQDGPYLIFVFSNEVAEQTLIPYDKYGQIYITLVDDFFTRLFQRLTPTLYGSDEAPPRSSFEGGTVAMRPSLAHWQQVCPIAVGAAARLGRYWIYPRMRTLFLSGKSALISRSSTNTLVR
jgi:hypothetical protein